MQSISAQIDAAGLPPSEARILMMHVLNKTRIQLITQSELLLSHEQLNAYAALTARRRAGEPIAYLTGEREFFGLALQVTPAVLIPRPDTELLVELAIEHTAPGSTVLDLGTGSGAIAIAIATQRADLQLWACDLSSAALEVAQRNAATHHCQIQFQRSDWYSDLPALRWTTIVSNPPYIERQDPHLSQGDLRFEPLEALTDHGDGLSAYRQIIAGATTRLTSGGWLLLEHGYNQAPAVRALLDQHGFTQIKSWQDLAGIERVTGGVPPLAA